MILTRAQIERIHEAIQEEVADEFALHLDAGGKLRFAAVLMVRTEKPVRLTHRKKDENEGEGESEA